MTEPRSSNPAERGANGWAAIARFGGVGDNLIVACCFKPLKQLYPRLEVITQLPQSVVFENNPYVDKLSVVGKDSIPVSPPDAWQNWFRQRSHEYDFFVHLSHSLETYRALLPTQTQFWWPAAARRKMCGHNYLETALDICGLPHEFGPLFFSSPQEQLSAQETKSRVLDAYPASAGFTPRPALAGWIINGTRIDKLYPYASIAISRLIKEVGPVVMLGAPSPSRDFELAKAIQADVIRHNGDDRGLHLGLSPDANNPTWPIRRVLSFAQACDIVIGPDTGPMWAVAFEPNKKVLLLSHASPENITKHWVNTVTLHADPAKVPCWPCHQLHNSADTCMLNADKNGAACISSINVDTIIQTASFSAITPDDGQRGGKWREPRAEFHAQCAARNSSRASEGKE
jgi:ADP-heptose:LPS heptosyltransferase